MCHMDLSLCFSAHVCVHVHVCVLHTHMLGASATWRQTCFFLISGRLKSPQGRPRDKLVHVTSVE